MYKRQALLHLNKLHNTRCSATHRSSELVSDAFVYEQTAAAKSKSNLSCAADRHLLAVLPVGVYCMQQNSAFSSPIVRVMAHANTACSKLRSRLDVEI